ncbi:MAG: extracellular solute-binding protein [Treponemataceae bacterium]|nr:extracellular solute-binding protein [Treponemataceae bacterium]
MEDINVKNKFFLASMMLLAVLFIFAGCNKSEKKELYLFNWTYYTPDSVIEQFKNEFGIDVHVDNFASNEEMFAKLKAGASGYDVVFPSQDYVSIMIAEGMLKELDHTKLPNLNNINPFVLSKATYDPEMKYSVPYYMGIAGIAVNKTKVSEYGKSWNIFGREDLKNRMCMMDDLREVIGDALVYLGYSVNSTNDAELTKAKNLIINDWKPNLVTFDAEGFGKAFARGDFWVVQGYEEVVFSEIEEAKWDTVDFFIPDEGGPMYLDSMCVLKDSKNYEAAFQFINFIHRPEVYAQFLDYFRFPNSVNKEADKYMQKEPAYNATDMERGELKYDLGEDLAKYNAIWQDIRFTE